MRYLLSLVQRKAHWPRHMVERFLQADYELLSDGEQLAASQSTFQRRTILPEAGWVRAVAPMRM